MPGASIFKGDLSLKTSTKFPLEAALTGDFRTLEVLSSRFPFFCTTGRMSLKSSCVLAEALYSVNR
jgi:hypothetical protein